MSRCRAVQHVIKALYVKVRKKFSRKFLIQFWSKCTKSITQPYMWRKRDVFYVTKLNLDRWESPKYTTHDTCMVSTIKWVQLCFITYSTNHFIGLLGPGILNNKGYIILLKNEMPNQNTRMIKYLPLFFKIYINSNFWPPFLISFLTSNLNS